MGNAQSDEGERAAAEVISFIPIIGSVYQLTAAAVYAGKGDFDEANKRGIDGGIGVALDVVSLGTGAGSGMKAGGVLIKGGIKKGIKEGSKQVVKGVVKTIAHAGTAVAGKANVREFIRNSTHV
ncbi:7884_t:CDS:1 [Ambispora leptoticha]|uniref:7884_t:CDS:1 n=1 Tax=Ambispora leptoticha TaxID=144679 RepID=A0A9N9EAH5_9GLOM|nr:7884_t:CDS:1 [Ambispora leptoticha]